MTPSKQNEPTELFELTNDGYAHLLFPWRQSAIPSSGFAFEFCKEVVVDDTKTVALYSQIDANIFARAVPVDERTQKDWNTNSKDILRRFDEAARLLFQTVERVTSDHLICRVLSKVHSGRPDVCIGTSNWDYLKYTNTYCLNDKNDGKRVFITFDGQSLWEILSIYPALSDGEPIRIEIVRQRGLPVGGEESVLLTEGLSFVEDVEARVRWTNHIQLLERDLSANRPRHVIAESAVAIDGLIQELGKQCLRKGRTLGDFSSEAKFMKATAIQRIAAWFGSNGIERGAKELERLRPQIDGLRQTRNTIAHPERESKLLVRPDVFTATFAYGVVREFVRLLQAIHKFGPNAVSPMDPIDDEHQPTNKSDAEKAKA